MPKLDPHYARLHKKYYERFLDALDKEIASAIMADPNGPEAHILNQQVDAAIKEELGESLVSVSN